MTNFFSTLSYIFQSFIGLHLILPFILFILWKLKRAKQPIKKTDQVLDYAIIVTAYQQTTFIPKVVESILKINYNNYKIYIVADHCSPDANLLFNHKDIHVLYPETVIASNTGSHFHAINNFKRNHDVLMIVDSDNLVDPEIINNLNIYFDNGYEAVQGIRKAKNLDTSFACLDAARDIYYHFYDGKILFEIGSSATLAGSGMAFTIDLYKKCLAHLDIKGAGFDKVLQSEILKLNKRIAFTEDAIIYDEKTSTSDQLVNQRSRWINTWFKYFSLGFTLLGKGITNFSFNQFIYGIILLRPPLFIFLILSVLFMFLNLFINPYVSFFWLLGLFIFVIGFAISLMNYKTDQRIYKALTNIPNFIFFQIISLTKVRIANKRSVATQHQYKN